MTIQAVKTNLKDLLEDNVQACIKELRRLLDKEAVLDDLRIIASSHKEYKKAENLTTVDRDTLQIERRKVVKSLLTFIGDLKETDFKSDAFQPQGMEENILVVSNDDAALTEMKRFFSAYFFKNVTYNASGKVVIPDNCDIVLFDNRIMGRDMYKEEDEKLLPKSAQEHLALLRAYLTKTTFNIVYFGDNLHLVTKNRNRINAANSKFTLYARIKETIDCMKYYKED
jgi:hypothetical protein